MTVDALLILVRKLERRIANMVSIGGSPPGAHATTHYDGASDPVDVTQLDGFTGSTSDFLRADGSFATPSGAGNVTGPGLSTDNAIARFDGTLGTAIQNSGITIADGASGTLAGTNSGDVTLAGTPNYLTIVGQVITQALIDLASHITGRLPFANLTQGSALSVLGVTGNATADMASIAAASDHQVLRRSGTAVAFGAVNLAQSAAVTGQLPLTNIAARTTSIEFLFDNNGAAIAANTKARGDIPVGATLTKWRILADVSGSIVFDIWKDTYANYPPTVGDTIIGGGGTKPTLSSQDKNEDSTLTGYTTSFSAGDTLIINVDSCTTITQAALILTFSY